MFDTDSKSSIWEQEFRNDTGFKKESNLFSYVEGGDELIGLFFSNEVEAIHFNAKIEERITKRRSRASLYASSNIIPPVKVSKLEKDSLNDQQTEDSESSSTWRIWKKKRVKRSERHLLRKSLIGSPDESTMVHFQGAGDHGIKKVELSGSLNDNDIDPKMHKFLTTYGLDSWLTDPSKAAEIKKWAEKTDFYGQLEEAKAERAKKRATRIPMSGGVLPKPPPPPPPISSSTKPTPIKVSNIGEVKEEETIDIEEV